MRKPAGIAAGSNQIDAATVHGIAQEAAHRVVLCKPDRVAGEMEVRSAHVDRAGRVHCGALFAFAHDLAADGCAKSLASSRLVDAKTILVAPGAANRVTGEAMAVAGCDQPQAWQVIVSDDRDAVLAIFVFSFLASDGHTTANANDMSASAPALSPLRSALPEPESRLDHIVSAAAEVIARKGFAQASIREIAEAAGLHVPTLYGHVSGKDELLELVYAKEMDLIAADLDQFVATGTPLEQLRNMIFASIEVIDRRRRQVGLLNRELKSLRPEARARTIARYKDLISRYEAVIEAGIESGDFVSVNPLVAANFFEMTSDIWGLRQFFFSELSLEDYRETVIALALHGICGRHHNPAVRKTEAD